VVGFEDFGYEVIKKGGEALGCDYEGNGGGTGGTSLRLHPSARG
jgi:hypothetical protein